MTPDDVERLRALASAPGSAITGVHGGACKPVPGGPACRAHIVFEVLHDPGDETSEREVAEVELVGWPDGATTIGWYTVGLRDGEAWGWDRAAPDAELLLGLVLADLRLVKSPRRDLVVGRLLDALLDVLRLVCGWDDRRVEAERVAAALKAGAASFRRA